MCRQLNFAPACMLLYLPVANTQSETKSKFMTNLSLSPLCHYDIANEDSHADAGVLCNGQ